MSPHAHDLERARLDLRRFGEPRVADGEPGERRHPEHPLEKRAPGVLGDHGWRTRRL